MSILIPVYGFVLLPCLTAARGDVDDFLLRVARTQWGLMLTVYCISHAPALLTLDIAGYRHEAYLLLFFLLTVSQFSNVAQYVVGKLFGRRRVAPVVSPSKTWEGLLGGGAAAMALGAGLWWITPFSPLVAAPMTLLLVVMGFFGGIVLSAVKRSMGVKDWGSMVQGHVGCWTGWIWWPSRRRFSFTSPGSSTPPDQRHRRCIHSHWPGYSRTQPSMTWFSSAVAGSMATLPVASRGRSNGPSSNTRKRPPGVRTARMP